MVAAAINTNNLLLWIGELVGFLILVWFFVRKKFGKERRSATQMVGRVLDARAARIEAQLRLADESRAEAQKSHEQAQEEIAQAHREAGRILERAQGIRGSLRLEMAATAEEEKDRIIHQARDAIEAERNRAILELRSKAADVAVEAAREVLARTMDETTDRALIARALVEDSPNGRGAGE